jgi:hypothetical protein
MIAPPNIADGTIISGRGPSSGKVPRKNSLAWEYMPNINELSKAIPINDDVAPL